MKKYSYLVLSGVTYSVAGLSSVAKAQDCNIQGGVTSGANCAKPPNAVESLDQQIKNITNTLLMIVGIAAVIMLIIGGLMYIFSGGDPNNTKRAKDVILYTIIGIAVALLAYAIVTFVVGRFQP